MSSFIEGLFFKLIVFCPQETMDCTVCANKDIFYCLNVWLSVLSSQCPMT